MAMLLDNPRPSFVPNSGPRNYLPTLVAAGVVAGVGDLAIRLMQKPIETRLAEVEALIDEAREKEQKASYKFELADTSEGKAVAERQLEKERAELQKLKSRQAALQEEQEEDEQNEESPTSKVALASAAVGALMGFGRARFGRLRAEQSAAIVPGTDPEVGLSEVDVSDSADADLEQMAPDLVIRKRVDQDGRPIALYTKLPLLTLENAA